MKQTKGSKAKNPTPKSRVNMRIDADLMKWVKKYAKKSNTCFTEIVISHLKDLRGNV